MIYVHKRSLVAEKLLHAAAPLRPDYQYVSTRGLSFEVIVRTHHTHERGGCCCNSSSRSMQHVVRARAMRAARALRARCARAARLVACGTSESIACASDRASARPRRCRLLCCHHTRKQWAV